MFCTSTSIFILQSMFENEASKLDEADASALQSIFETEADDIRLSKSARYKTIILKNLSSVKIKLFCRSIVCVCRTSQIQKRCDVTATATRCRPIDTSQPQSR